MCKQLFIYLLLFITYVLDGQDLPRGFQGDEKVLMPSYLSAVTSYDGSVRSVEVPGPVRSMAEWEELQGLIISWTNSFRDIQAEIVRNTIPQCKIIIACSNPASVKSFLATKSINDSVNVHYVTGNYNSIWVRDYGPNSVYAFDVDSLYLVDWIYNRPRYQDDTLARQLSRSLGLPLLETNKVPDDLVHTGGNYMSDGLGFAFSSLLVMDENGPDNEFGLSNHSEAEVDSIMHRYMGTKTYVKMNTLPYDAIHHIDMHMKILDEQNILVGKYENDVSDGAQINANIDYILSSFKNTFGKPYQIHYVPMPPGPDGRYPYQNGDYRTYTNSVFVNRTVLVPFYEEKYDTVARNVYESLLPGYNIVGIDCNKIIPSLGAIHCITKEVGVTDPLMIAVDQAAPLIEVQNESERTIRAIVRNRSGIDQVWLYYQPDHVTGIWDSVRMDLISPDESMYSGVIPVFDSIAYYYVRAVAVSGKTISRPMTAPEGYFKTRAIRTSAVDQIQPSLSYINIYPNPAQAVTCIDLGIRNRHPLKVSLVDGQGRVAAKLHDGPWDVNQTRLFFDASALPAGLYFVKIEGKGIFQLKPVIVIHS